MSLVALLLSATACVATAGSRTSAHNVTAEPTAAEARLFAALHVRGGNGIPPLEAALTVGGPGDPAELAMVTASLDQTLGALLANLPADPVARGRAVLEVLFSTRAGRPLLRQYSADATTLYEVVTTGRFNCVSATMLYLLAARRVGVDARPVLLPSHARALVVANGRSFVVETTTAHGFDASPKVSKDALDRARPKGTGPHVDLYADEHGTEVDWNALLGIAYGNLGIMAQSRGETALAASLLARELTLTPPAQAPLVKAQEASLLTELATCALGVGKFDEARALAFLADGIAPDTVTKNLTEQNLAAIASQELVARGATMDDATLEAFAEPFRGRSRAYGDVHALALTTLADRRLKRGDVEGSAAALREAARVASSSDLRGQADHNARRGELNRLGRLSATDPERAFREWQALGPPDPALGTTEAEVAQAIAENRAIALSNAGRCPELDQVLGGTVPVSTQGPRANALRASCRARRGIQRSDAGDVSGALADLREAVRLDPDGSHHKQNLAVVIEKQIDQLVHNHGCQQIAPLVTEGQALDPRSTFFAEVTEFCRHETTGR